MFYTATQLFSEIRVIVTDAQDLKNVQKKCKNKQKTYHHNVLEPKLLFCLS